MGETMVALQQADMHARIEEQIEDDLIAPLRQVSLEYGGLRIFVIEY